MIRHAESEANKNRIMASRKAFPLTKEGKAEADLIAVELKETVIIDRIITSPLVRARQTAESFAKVYNLPLEEDIRVAEQELGKFSGMSYDEVKLHDDYETETGKRWNWVPLGGESYEMIALRVKSFFNDLTQDQKEESVLIVTHAVTFRLIRGLLENSLPQYPSSFPNNGEIWKVDFTGLGKFYEIESIMLGNSEQFVHNP